MSGHRRELAFESAGTRVVCTDLVAGESEEAVIRDDYVVITDGDRYVDGLQVYPKSGTVVVTIKRRTSEGSA